ncbi:MAG: DNA-directed RNA polymerase subunit omega [Deltaproteobacteria bacterium RBG_16_54_11]|nr:MAG: DNA-directed RNA polymerase subunit omega [Deltaproteobacteria bacterium RBG_16_54_11]
MARITVEDCLRRVESRFSLVVLAVKRVKMLIKGAHPLVNTDNKFIVNALREIAAGKVSYAYEPEGGVAEAETPRVKFVEKEEAGAKEDAD